MEEPTEQRGRQPFACLAADACDRERHDLGSMLNANKPLPCIEAGMLLVGAAARPRSV